MLDDGVFHRSISAFINIQWKSSFYSCCLFLLIFILFACIVNQPSHCQNAVLYGPNWLIGDMVRENLGSYALRGQVMITGMDGPSAKLSEAEKRHLHARAYALSLSTSSSRR